MGRSGIGFSGARDNTRTVNTEMREEVFEVAAVAIVVNRINVTTFISYHHQYQEYRQTAASAHV